MSKPGTMVDTRSAEHRLARARRAAVQAVQSGASVRSGLAAGLLEVDPGLSVLKASEVAQRFIDLWTRDEQAISSGNVNRLRLAQGLVGPPAFLAPTVAVLLAEACIDLLPRCQAAARRVGEAARRADQ